MKQITITLLSALFLLFAPIATLSVTVSAQADLACEGLLGGDCSDAAPDTEPQVGGVLETSLNLLSLVAGVIAVIMVIIAGVRFITSQGDPGKVAGARSAVIYAVIGIVIVAMAQTIVFFVLKEATGTPAPPAEPETTEIIQRIAYSLAM
jgi:heme/copper-type cytochrome/quinol oxidase subunit 2